MKRVLLFSLIFVFPFVSVGQVDKLFKKVKDKVNYRVDKNVNKAIDKSLDEAEESVKNGGNSGTAGATTTKATSATNTPDNPATSAVLKSYARYDFVPGEKVIYANDFATDNMGELPTGWNSNGSGAVVTISGQKGNWAQFYQNSVYLTDNKESFTENFTVEFDLILRRENPKAAFPVLAFGFFAAGTESTTSNDFLKEYAKNFATELKIQPYDNNASHMHYESLDAHKRFLNTDIKKTPELEKYFNKIIHVAMQVQKERLRIWMNEEKLYDLPKAIKSGTDFNQLFFAVKRYGGADSEVGYNVTNIKIAKGIPDTRHKLIDEGAFSTTGILFDVNTATIKPESNGVLTEIAGILKKHTEVKIKIVGHTDSDGSDASNLELSLKRSGAVKDALVKDFGIEASRIETEGKGESAPVADNKTKEGKAGNRRVEFIKL
jgi:OOP family OmpA-OmpF porin